MSEIQEALNGAKSTSEADMAALIEFQTEMTQLTMTTNTALEASKAAKNASSKVGG